MSAVRSYVVVTRPLRDNQKRFDESRHEVRAYSAEDAIAQVLAVAGKSRICDMERVSFGSAPMVEVGAAIVSVAPLEEVAP